MTYDAFESSKPEEPRASLIPRALLPHTVEWNPEIDSIKSKCQNNRLSHYISRVRKLNLGWCSSASKVVFSWPFVDRFGINFGGLMTLGQVKNSRNVCSFGPQRAEKCNIWRGKNSNLNSTSGLCLFSSNFEISSSYIFARRSLPAGNVSSQPYSQPNA